MNKGLRNLYNLQRELKAKAGDILNNVDATEEEINSLYKEIENIEAKIVLAKAIDDGEESEGEPLAKIKNSEDKQEFNAKMFYNVISGNATPEEVKIANTYKREFRNKLQESNKEDGGYTVPEDLTKEIIESIKIEESVRNLVRVESTNTLSGQRIFKTGTPNMLYNTDERGKIKEMNNPKYGVKPFKIAKFAGIMDISNELLDDSFINFKSEMVDWLSDSARNTENDKILYGTGTDEPEGLLLDEAYYKEMTAPAEIDVKFLRSIKNKILQGYRDKAQWVMNTEAFETLSNIEDKNGRGVLAEDPRKADSYTLFGRPIVIYDTIKTETGLTVIAFGDFKRAYRFFDRKAFDIKFSDIAAGAFETDTVKVRGIARFDGRRMDKEALVIVRGVPAPL